MEIWAHTMVKNEARWLWYSVISIIDHIDKLLLWDTGSSDGTLEIEKELIKKYPTKIIYKERKQTSSHDFTVVRQEMLEETKSDWFLMVDGDEIWWQDSIRKLVSVVKNDSSDIESIIVPTINTVGDIFHYQNKDAGMYKFGDLKGHYNLRAIKRSISGLHSQGSHGVWGWADAGGKMIQDRDTKKIRFIDAPYLHTTFLQRGAARTFDQSVIKRSKKLKYEIGVEFPKDFYYPEVLFQDTPTYQISPWNSMTPSFELLAYLETPLRHIKRKIWTGRSGY